MIYDRYTELLQLSKPKQGSYSGAASDLAESFIFGAERSRSRELQKQVYSEGVSTSTAMREASLYIHSCLSSTRE